MNLNFSGAQQFLRRGLSGGGDIFLGCWFHKDSDAQTIASSKITTSSHCVKTCMSSCSMMRHPHCKSEETALQHCSTSTLISALKSVHAREKAQLLTFHGPTFDPCSKSCNFSTFYSSVIRTSDDLLMWSPLCKLLKTWQLLASCEGGASPSWQ